jgi:hypothetical protein
MLHHCLLKLRKKEEVGSEKDRKNIQEREREKVEHRNKI